MVLFKMKMSAIKKQMVLKNLSVIAGQFEDSNLPKSFLGIIDDHFCNTLKSFGKCTHKCLLQGCDVYGRVGFVCDCGMGFRSKDLAEKHFKENTGKLIEISTVTTDFVETVQQRFSKDNERLQEGQFEDNESVVKNVCKKSSESLEMSRNTVSNETCLNQHVSQNQDEPGTSQVMVTAKRKCSEGSRIDIANKIKKTQVRDGQSQMIKKKNRKGHVRRNRRTHLSKTNKSPANFSGRGHLLSIRQRRILRTLFELHPIRLSNSVCKFLRSKYSCSDALIRKFWDIANSKRKEAQKSNIQCLNNPIETVRIAAEKLYLELKEWNMMKVSNSEKDFDVPESKLVVEEVFRNHGTDMTLDYLEKCALILNENPAIVKWWRLYARQRFHRNYSFRYASFITEQIREKARIVHEFASRRNETSNLDDGHNHDNGNVGSTESVEDTIHDVKNDTQDALLIMACVMHEFGVTDDEGYLESCAAFLEVDESEVMSFVANQKWMEYDRMKFTNDDKEAALELHTDVMECMRRAWQSTEEMTEEQILETNSTVRCTCGQCVFCMLKS